MGQLVETPMVFWAAARSCELLAEDDQHPPEPRPRPLTQREEWAEQIMSGSREIDLAEAEEAFEETRMEEIALQQAMWEAGEKSKQAERDRVAYQDMVN